MRILFILIGPDTIASSRVRVYQFLPRLQTELNVQATVRVSGSALPWRLPAFAVTPMGFFVKRWRLIATWFSAWFSGSYDLVFIHRVLLPSWLVRRITLLRKPILFDFDDALSLEGFYSKRISEHRLEAILKAANLVITSSAYNADYVRGKCHHTEIIASSVDINRYRAKSSHRHPPPVIIGWIGSPSTTPYLMGIGSVLCELGRKHSIKVHTIGADRRFRLPDVEVVHKSWSEQTEVNDLLECDIGIMPLPDNEWTRGKGGYKLLQYMAAGLPVIASPVTINCEIVQDGLNGFLATTEQEWLEKLSLLIEDGSLRESMGQKGRAFVEQRYSAEKAYRQLADALTAVRKTT